MGIKKVLFCDTCKRELEITSEMTPIGIIIEKRDIGYVNAYLSAEKKGGTVLKSILIPGTHYCGTACFQAAIVEEIVRIDS